MALASATLAQNSYAWLIPSPGARLWVSILFCLTPGLNEMMGNLANLNWVLFFWLTLLSLKDIKVRLSGYEILLASLAILSSGTSALLLPLYMWRLWAIINPKKDIQALWANAVIFLEIGSMTLWLASLNIKGSSHLLDSRPLNRHALPNMSQMIHETIPALFHTFEKTVLLRPWLGNGFASQLIDKRAAPILGLFLIALAYSCLLGWALLNRKKPFCQALLFFSCGMFFWPLLRSLSRSGSVSIYLDGNYWAIRHAFPLSFTAVLLWTTTFRPEPGGWKTARGKLALAFLALNSLHGLDRFFIRAYEFGEKTYPHERRWQRNSPALERAMKTGCPSRVTIGIYPWPEEWFVRYESGREAECLGTE